MKRLTVLVLTTIAALALLTGTASAHTIPDTTVDITCTSVTFQWENFPAEQQVTINLVIVQGTNQQTGTVNTNGQPDGTGHVALTLDGIGPVQVEFNWAIDTNGTHEVVVTRTLDCTPVEPPTTAPPTTVVETPTTVGEPTSALIPPVSVTPAELPRTGSNPTAPLAVAGALLAIGTVLIAATRSRRATR